MTPALEKLLQNEIAAYRDLVRDTGYQPPPWILPEPSCSLLKKICTLEEMCATPLHAFEFGSGCSTLALRSSCISVTSVEDSAEWLAKTEDQAKACPKRDADLTAVVPLTACSLGLVTCKSFDIETRPELLNRLKKARFVLVDSPPNPATREHALILALRYTPAGAVIILDDLEIQAALRFSTRLGRDNADSFDFQYVPIDHGLGLFEKKGPTNLVLRPSLREIVGAWMRS